MRSFKIAAAAMAATMLVLGLAGCKNSYRDYDKIDIEQISSQTTPNSEVETSSAADAYLGGARITLLSNQSASQMLSCVIESKEGSVIVVDGGTWEDAGHLADIILSKGGRVDTWLVTHPHSDHVGALTELLSNEQYHGITIDHLYYSIEPQEWYEEIDSQRAETVSSFRTAAESGLAPEARHEYSPAGTQFAVDEITIQILNEPYLIPDFNALNDSSVVYMLTINQKKVVFLGDLGPKAGAMFMADYSDRLDWLDCDVLQMSHHGQYGVEEEVYRALNPEICLWPTPDWLWDNDDGGGYNSGPWFTLDTRKWMTDLGVTRHYCIKDGDQVIE